MTAPVIAVTGCIPEMPDSFPLDFPENAGNMIHARAPMEMFPHAVYSGTTTPPWDRNSSFRAWANEKASHLIVTVANFLKVSKEGDDGTKYRRFQRMLEPYETNIVIFGLGAQAPTTSLEDAFIAPEAIDLMRFLGERCKVVGVRGEYTRQVFQHFAGVENTFVTGCPSLFSRPHSIKKMWQHTIEPKRGLPSYSGTTLHKAEETKMLVESILRRQFLLEPVNKHNHQFFLDSVIDPDNANVPWFLNGPIKDPDNPLTRERAVSYFAEFYRIFRSTDAWYKFNDEMVSFTYGTRFHVNMASLLSGVPTTWVTHDSRTKELTDFLHLPTLTLEEAHQMSPEEIRLRNDPTDFFDHVHGLFDRFSDYLEIFDLPRLKLEF